MVFLWSYISQTRTISNPFASRSVSCHRSSTVHPKLSQLKRMVRRILATARSLELGGLSLSPALEKEQARKRGLRSYPNDILYIFIHIIYMIICIYDNIYMYIYIYIYL